MKYTEIPVPKRNDNHTLLNSKEMIWLVLHDNGKHPDDDNIHITKGVTPNSNISDPSLKLKLDYVGVDDIKGGFNAIKHRMKESIKHRISTLNSATRRLPLFLRNLFKLDIQRVHIDPAGFASMVYIKKPVTRDDYKHLKSFIETCDVEFGNHIEYQGEFDGDLVFKIRFGSREEYAHHDEYANKIKS